MMSVQRAEQAKGKTASGGPPPRPTASGHRQNQRDQRKAEKELKNLEKRIARLDDDKRTVNDRLMTETNPDEAVRLHEELTKIVEELNVAEERWIELSNEE